MESNKLLIGVTFHYLRKIHQSNNTVQQEMYEYVQEFIVPRDATLKQLLDGIYYGLKKCIKEYAEANDTKSEAYRREAICFICCQECLSVVEHNGRYPLITITSFDGAVNGGPYVNKRICISKEDEKKKLYELGFLSSTRLVFDNQENYQSIPVVDKNNQRLITAAFLPDNNEPELVFPKFNISNRQLYQFDREPVRIIPPSQMPQKPKNNLFVSMLPMLIMALSMMLMRSMMGGSGGVGMYAMYGVMAMAGIVSSVVMALFQRREYKKDLLLWRENYQKYLDSICDEVEERQQRDQRKLDELYPEIHTVIESIVTGSMEPFINGRVFSRVANDEDFLSIRLGNSHSVETIFDIKGEKKDEMFSEESFEIVRRADGVGEKTKVLIHLPQDKDYNKNINTNAYLNNLPYALAKRYEYMPNAALLFSLKYSSCLGIVSSEWQIAEDFIAKMLFDICYYHSPEELQVVFLFKKAETYAEIEQKISCYKFLPHFRELFNDKSQFVFDNRSANLVFGSTLNILKERENTDAVKPHIVFIVYDEYSLKEHLLASYLPKVPEETEQKNEDGKKTAAKHKNQLGISFVFVKQYKEHLPSYCTDVIDLYPDNKASLTPRHNLNKQKWFRWREGWQKAAGGHIDIAAYNAYKLLAGLVYLRISQNGKVPSGISFFELCQISAGNMPISYNWGYKEQLADDGTTEKKRRYDITKSLKVPIGRTEFGITYLDLHEDADGPHMLVAGTTGSGKSETIISYLLSLCLHFSPEELNLMLVDMKGGGFIKRLENLPHIVGTVTDVAGDESGTGDEYMVRRFLESLRCEIKRRKLLLNQMHVDSADKYIAACRDIETHIKELSHGSGEFQNNPNYIIPDADALRELAKSTKLPHLVLVVDEFTELKRFTGESDDVDFIGEITTIARVGRSLGLHIILVSQNIENAITDDIRVNSRARLCLKVATKQASKEMIGSEHAASPTMPGHGRAYLLVGTGSKFEYFQSAYTGTSITESLDVPFEMIRAEKTGEYRKFYRSDKDNAELNRQRREMRESGQLITQCSAIVNEIGKVFKKEYPNTRLHQIFQPPLPLKVTLKDGQRFVIK